VPPSPRLSSVAREPSAADDDETLIAEFVAGRESAFAELVKRHEDRIFALALKTTGNRADALDATQETFIQAFRKAHAFRGEAAFSTWLYRVGLNACRDLLRKKARAPVPHDDVVADDPDPRPGPHDTVVTQLDLRAALAALSDDYREAVVMHDLGGIPYHEIATLTGVEIGTVKSRISRGRRRLAELLEQDDPSPSSKDRA
jgi:RNA polymerase sigma-70 factor (ECF subfamily)